MAMKPLRPCRHPGCPALTREGYCDRHKPKPAARRASAEYHAWYSLPVWTDELRPGQLLAEPWCRECAKRGIRTRATVVDHVEPHRGNWARPISRACASAATTGKQRRSRRKSGETAAETEGQILRKATSAPERERVCLPGRAQGQAFGLPTLPHPEKISGEGSQDRAAPRL